VASTTVKIAGLLVRCAYSPVERADGIIGAPSNLGNFALSMSQGTLFRLKNAHHSAARDAAPIYRPKPIMMFLKIRAPSQDSEKGMQRSEGCRG